MASSLAAEALVAATGVTPLLERAPRPVTKAQVSAAKRLPQAILALLRDFLDKPAHEPERPDPPAFDYDQLREGIFETEPDAQAVARLIGSFEDTDLAEAYLEALRTGVLYLQGVIPRETRQTLLGVEDEPPSEVELATFRRQWEVANDPLTALRDLVAGPITPDQVETLAAVYPGLYEETKRAVLQLLVERRAKDEAYTLPYQKQLGLEILFQVDAMDPAFQRELQAASKQKAEGEAKPAMSRLDADVEGLQTPTQRIQAR